MTCTNRHGHEFPKHRFDGRDACVRCGEVLSRHAAWQRRYRAGRSTVSAIHKRGFGSMSPEQKRVIASLGGIAAHAHGTAHEFSHEEAVIAGRKGGARSSQVRAQKQQEAEAPISPFWGLIERKARRASTRQA